jgi:murein DD-endopeptidase MepM/ murein hydrolase activator NlpD
MMRCPGIFFLILSFAPLCAGAANSYLTAQSFPKTFSDLSFVERVEVLREGYAPYESEYDEKGVCISGCAYQGITIEENAARIERETAIAVAKLEEYKLTHPQAVAQVQSASAAATPAVIQPSQPLFPSYGTSGQTFSGGDFAARACVPANPSIPTGQTMPYGEPLTGRPRISSRFQKARLNPKDKVVRDHNGTDFAAPTGTPIFSPAGGVVDRVFTDAACGNGIIVKHSAEWGTGYCHLSRATVQKGEQVQAGCKIGEVGSTGRSTGAHLHYIVYHNKEMVNSEQFLGR